MQSPVVVGPLDLSKLVSVAPHVPLIRFRKGLEQEQKEQHVAVASAASSPLLPISDDVLHESGVLEWWQKPQRFARQPLDEQEIDVINGGGADVVFR